MRYQAALRPEGVFIQQLLIFSTNERERK